MKPHQDRRPSRRSGAVKGFILVALLVFLWMLRTARAERADGLFGQLGEGRSVEVVFSSTGCFHDETYEFEFRRAPALTAVIVHVEKKWDEATQKRMVAKRVTLGTVKVTDAEAAGLDRLLDFYRKSKSGGCTTEDRISVTLRDAKTVISRASYVDATCQTRQMEGLTLFSDLTDKLLSKPKREVEKVRDLKKEREDAMEVCRGLAEYGRFEKSFTVTDAMIGCINSMPESLFVEIEATHPAIIDATRWWNPLVDGKPSLNWDDFMKAHAAAETAMAMHPWLRNWKKLPGKRSLELQLLGRDIGTEPDDLKTDIIPLWRHAGFTGNPTHSFLARRGDHGWITIYFGDKEERALMTSNSKPDQGASSPLDRADVYWQPSGKPGEKYARYAVIGNDGQCHVETFVSGEEK